jgi:hypothetical protein
MMNEGYFAVMQISRRNLFYFSLSGGLLGLLLLLWVWQPERQVRRHTAKLFNRVEAHDWNAVAELMSNDYRDQWEHDRARVIDRMRDVMKYMHGVRFIHAEPIIRIDDVNAVWIARITVHGSDGEVMALVKDRINSIATPFMLEWRRASKKPWDWKLVRVGNPDLQLGNDLE